MKIERDSREKRGFGELTLGSVFTNSGHVYMKIECIAVCNAVDLEHGCPFFFHVDAPVEALPNAKLVLR
jgi:hypothetical protein